MGRFGRGKKKEEGAPYPRRRDLAAERIKRSIARITNEERVHTAVTNLMKIPSLELENRQSFAKKLASKKKEILALFEKDSKYYKEILSGNLDSLSLWGDANPEPDLDTLQIRFQPGPGDVAREAESRFE